MAVGGAFFKSERPAVNARGPNMANNISAVIFFFSLMSLNLTDEDYQ